MARSFSRGSSEYLEIASTPVTAAPLTIAAWVRVTNPATWTQLAICSLCNQGATDQMFALEIRNENTVFARALTRQGGTFARAVATNTLSYGTWYHCAAIFTDSANRACLVDGANKGTNTTSAAPSGVSGVSIGRYGDSSPGSYYNGEIANVGIWNTALTDAEVAILATGYSPLFVRPQSLAPYWRLVRDEDQDIVGGYDLTAYNTPTIAAHPAVLYPAPPLFIGLTAAAAARIPRHPAAYNQLAIY